MKTSFHTILAVKAGYHATMLAEPMLGRQMSVDTANVLVRNLSAGYLERTMPVTDALVRELDPTGRILPSFSYDEVMTMASPADLERSARRAAGSVPEFAVVEGEHEAALLAAIATELTYLWLRSCERAYERFAKAAA